MRLMGHMVSIRDKRVHSSFWWGNLKEIDHLEDLGLDGIIILK
jgi:hypothetical protein